MRILVTAESISPSTGGGRVGILGLCRGLTRRGHQVTLIATNADGKNVLDVPLGVPTLQQGVAVYFYSVQLSILGNLISIPIAVALKRQVAQSDIVLIHSLYRFTSTMAAHYCRKYNVPYILRPHGTLDPFLLYRRRSLLKLAYINLFERKNFQFAAAIQYSSQMEEKTARQFISVKSQSIIIEEGIDINRFLNLSASGCFRSKHSEMSNKVLVLFLGRFHQKKGLELLIYAFAAVSERCPKAHLVLAGSGDLEYVSSLIQIISDLGLTNCSTVTGQLSEDDKLSALADSDLFVLPSHGENFGIAVVEAMASGLPVLISDKVGIWPTVVESDAGIVTVCDAAKIADAIVLIVNNPDLREKLGRNGRILAQRQFSLDRMAEKMEIEYCKLRSTSS